MHPPSGGVGAVRQDKGHPAEVGGGDGDGLQEILVKEPLPKGQQLPPGGVGEAPRDLVQGFAAPGEEDGDGEGQAVVPHQPGNLPLGEVPLRPFLGSKGHRGAHQGGLQGFQKVGAVGVAGPTPGLAAAGGLGFDDDGIGDHKAGKEADTKAADKVLRQGAVGVQHGFGGLADDGKKLMDLLPGEAGPVVLKNQAGPRIQADGQTAAGPGGLAFFPQRNGVHSVLHQFPKKDIGAFIEVVGQDVQHPA